MEFWKTSGRAPLREDHVVIVGLAIDNILYLVLHGPTSEGGHIRPRVMLPNGTPLSPLEGMGSDGVFVAQFALTEEAKASRQLDVELSVGDDVSRVRIHHAISASPFPPSSDDLDPQ